MFNVLRLTGPHILNRTTNFYVKNTLNVYKNVFLNKQERNYSSITKYMKNSLLTPQRSIVQKVIKCSSQQIPNKSKKLVGYWLMGCGGMVFVAVVLGGVTRLTESGLSMVTWKLLGERKPQNDAEWLLEFQNYQQFPEYKLKNTTMTLAEFKYIYWMEYLHRMWGRGIGAFFAVPAIYFWSKGYFGKAMKIRVGAFATLIGLQGLMGWYMVKSGLEAENFKGPNDVPRVSQYRLASHLSLALILYMSFVNSALDHLLPAKEVVGKITEGALKIRRLAHISKGMIFLTAVSGAFVAGLDAGLVYNSFPKMADRWIPSDILAFSPKLRNFTENPTTVQFDHRILGITTLSLISGMWFLSRGKKLPSRAYSAANAVALMGWTQVLLGITTLLSYVPIPLAASHQSGSLILLTFAIWLTHELKLVKRLPK